MAHLGHGCARLEADNFHHLGHVYAVMPPVVGLINEELNYLKFVCP
jgi:hypothetical protein